MVHLPITCPTRGSTDTSMKRACAQSTDRLSDLPDALLANILSLLRAREAVRTCVLSKRWRGLWAYAPSVSIDYEEFRSGDEFDQEKFICFVDSYFIHRKISLMDSFQLRWFHPNIDSLLAFIRIDLVAYQCKPRSVCLNLGGYFSPMLPQSLFTCNSIEEMTLVLSNLIDVPTVFKPRSISLPRLKSLTLTSVALNNDFTNKLIPGCPVLEELVLKRCKLNMSDISSPGIRSLSIEYCQLESEVVVSMPNLVELKMVRVESGMILLRNISSLLTASLSLCSTKSESQYKKSKFEFLSGLSNATYIELYESHGYTQIRGLLVREFTECPTFNNLKILYLNECFVYQDFVLIAWFIHLAPNLEKLIVRPRENLMWDWRNNHKLSNYDDISKLVGMPEQFNCGQLEVEIQYRDIDSVSEVLELVRKLMENMIFKKISIARW